MITTVALFMRLDALRVAGGYTIAAICRELGVKPLTYYRWRYGHKDGRHSIPLARQEPDLRRVINWLLSQQ